MGGGRKSSEPGFLTHNCEINSTVRVCQLHFLRLYTLRWEGRFRGLRSGPACGVAEGLQMADNFSR
jgi:hypothetical protein